MHVENCLWHVLYPPAWPDASSRIHRVCQPSVLSRIKSTTGINKITKTMKMVSASKMKGDEERLKNGRPFQVRGRSKHENTF